MKKFTKYMLMVGLLAIAGCTWGNGEGSDSGKDSDSVAHHPDSVIVLPNGDMLYRGTVVDGSRRNISLKFYDDTLDFEIPYYIDFTYEVGDSISILVKVDSNGADSIASLENLSM